MASVITNKVMSEGDSKELHPFFTRSSRPERKTETHRPSSLPPSPKSDVLAAQYELPGSSPSNETVERDYLNSSTQLHETSAKVEAYGRMKRLTHLQTRQWQQSMLDATGGGLKFTQGQNNPSGDVSVPETSSTPKVDGASCPTGLSSSVDGRHMLGSTKSCLPNHHDPQKESSPSILQALSTAEQSDVAGHKVIMNPSFAPSRSIDNTNEPPRKLLKLNPNGKLLSSPPSKNCEDGHHKYSSTRPKGKSGRHGRSLVITLKYGEGERTKEDIGCHIDNIITGKQILARAVKRSEPAQPKPTHPFFLKGPLRQQTAPTNTTHSPEYGAARNPSETMAPLAETVEKHPSQSPKMSVPFTRHTFVKHPVPILPIWPPSQLTGVTSRSTLQPSTSICMTRKDLRKAKNLTVQINDAENVLSSEMRCLEESSLHTSYLVANSKVLRTPKRYLASGKVVIKGVLSRLSNSDTVPLRQRCHHAIIKTYNALPKSMSSFDLGAFESALWVQKYAPKCAEEVLQNGPEPIMLRNWLKSLTVDTVSKTEKKREPKRSDSRNRAKRRKTTDKLDGFIISSDEEASEMDELTDSEDELAGDVTVPFKKTLVRTSDVVTGNLKEKKKRIANAILISGPSGCGKTASVYAVAKELGFEVFEINSGSRRSARDILERVGDMTQNHLVHPVDHAEGKSSGTNTPNNEMEGLDKQTTMNTFFQKSTPKVSQCFGARKSKKDAENPPPSLPYRSQRQSLILLEEADVLFEEDKQFWTAVLSLMEESKRPIIITCNDESLIPLSDLSLHAILRYRRPPIDLSIDYLLLLAAHEGHMLSREAVSSLYKTSNHDLRKTIMDLNYWCQMGVGSEKSGLDWIPDRWPAGVDLDALGHPNRVISLNTYLPFMGWLSRDILLSGRSTSIDAELKLESMDWWGLGIEDSAKLGNLQGSSEIRDDNLIWEASRETNHDSLSQADEMAEFKSFLDILSCRLSMNPNENKDQLDTTNPRISEKAKSNYIEGIPLLQADLQNEFPGTSADMCTALTAILDFQSPRHNPETKEAETAKRVLNQSVHPRKTALRDEDFKSAFQPISEADYVFPAPSGRIALSLERVNSAMMEDTAPYIRAIMAFDLRLEQYRMELSGLISQGGGNRKIRKTRASRAALEGGDKANTRKERWFSHNANPARILATGGKEWQDILHQSGYLQLATLTPERGGLVRSLSESSGNGGF